MVKREAEFRCSTFSFQIQVLIVRMCSSTRETFEREDNRQRSNKGNSRRSVISFQLSLHFSLFKTNTNLARRNERGNSKEIHASPSSFKFTFLYQKLVVFDIGAKTKEKSKFHFTGDLLSSSKSLFATKNVLEIEFIKWRWRVKEQVRFARIQSCSQTSAVVWSVSANTLL